MSESAPLTRPVASAQVPSPATPRCLPFAVFVSFLVLASFFPADAGGEWDARWLPVIRGLAVALLLAYWWPRYEELRRVPRVPLRDWVLAVGAGLAVFLAWIQFDSGWATLGAGGAGFDPTRPDGRVDPLLVALRLFGMALVVPVMEELFWRSFLMRWLSDRDFLRKDPRTISLRVFFLTAVLFASEHSLWFAGLIAGITYNYVYIRTANLWIPVVAHAVTNTALGLWILHTRNWQLW